MNEAAQATSLQILDQIMRHSGPRLLDALAELYDRSEAKASDSLEQQLARRGVRQNILDNLELSRHHFRRGLILFREAQRACENAEVSREVDDRIQQCLRSQWEHLFGLTFLAFVAGGEIPEDSPGVDLMLAWMRSSSREVYVHAAAAEQGLRVAAA
ncbi:MAG: hypothetical protein KC420_02890 [Myxococcales bacterium]|nr:hypothetical protein [Myxococcales bacterium]